MKNIILLVGILLFSSSRAMESRVWGNLRNWDDPTPSHTSHQEEKLAASIRLLARHGKFKEISYLLEGVQNPLDIINSPDETGKTALHLAAAYNHDLVIMLLIQAGANINAQDAQGNTPLIAAAYFKHKSAIEMLLAFKAEVNLQNHIQQTALHTTFFPQKNKNEKDYFELVQLLLKAQADPNIRDGKHGNTPIHLAVLNNYTTIIPLLAQYNADPMILNQKGFAPIESAVHIEKVESLKALLASYPNNDWDSVLYLLQLVVAKQDMALVEILLNNGFNPYKCITDKENQLQNAYHVASSFYNPKLLELLLAHDHKALGVNQQNRKGRTPLMIVIRMTEGATKKEGTQLTIDQSIELITLLKKNGADSTITDNEGKTVIERAKKLKLFLKSNNQKLIDILINKE